MVEWTDPAKQDLKSIHDFISRDSRLYAKKVSFEIVEKTEKLNFLWGFIPRPLGRFLFL